MKTPASYTSVLFIYFGERNLNSNKKVLRFFTYQFLQTLLSSEQIPFINFKNNQHRRLLIHIGTSFNAVDQLIQLCLLSRSSMSGQYLFYLINKKRSCQSTI